MRYIYMPYYAIYSILYRQMPAADGGGGAFAINLLAI